MPDGLDEFSSNAAKFRALLGLPREARVLLVGQYFADNVEDFSRVFSFVHVVRTRTELPVNGSTFFDLVFVDLFTEADEAMDLAVLANLEQFIVAGGHVIVAAHHHWWPQRALRFLARARSRSPQYPPRKVYRSLRAARFEPTARLLAFPSHAQAANYLDPSVASANQPSFGPLRERMASHLGLAGVSHPHSFYLARAGGSARPLELLDQVARALGYDGAVRLRIVSLSLRSRGALILHCTNGIGECIIRLALTQDVRDRVTRNAACTQRLHAATMIPKAVRLLVPEPIAQFAFGDAHVFVESRLMGVELWRLRKESHAAMRGTRETIAFTRAFEDAVTSEVRVDAGLFRDAFAVSYTRLPALLDRAGVSQHHLDAVLQQMAQRMIGRRFRVGLGHGDLHLGNVLVDARTGQLCGVVDWDTHLTIEFAGVDRAHFIMHAESWRTGTSVTEVAAALARAGDQNECIMLAIALVRVAERAANFPSEFQRSAARLGTYLECADRILSAIVPSPSGERAS